VYEPITSRPNEPPPTTGRVASQEYGVTSVAVVVDAHHPAYGAVDPSVALVVVEQHHLSADLEPQRLLDGWVEQRQVSVDPCVVDQFVARQSFELLTIAGRHQAVGRRQRQPELVVGRNEIGIGAGIELLLGVP
jgi:hypothetical protein